MDAIQEEFGVVSEHGGQTFVLGRPISPRLDRQGSYSYGSERSLSSTSSYHDSQDLSSIVSSSSSSRPLSAQALRSRVSMDAIPQNVRDFTADSLRSQESGSPTDDASITARPHVRNSVPMPTCEDENKEPVGPHAASWVCRVPPSPPGPSRNHQAREDSWRSPRLTPPGQGEDEDEDGHKTPRAIADETLRSAPGVRGVGEGWAGGPRPGSKTGWWRGKKSPETEDDPLSLWTRHVEADQMRKNSLTASPVRALWNRSVQAFGSSMPHLSLTPGDRKKGGMGKRGSAEDQSIGLQDTGRRGHSLTNLFARSTTALAPLSMSTPHLATTTRNTATAKTSRSTTSETSHYLTPPLTRAQDASPNPDSPEAWQRRDGRGSGPRPPWRPPTHSSPSNAPRASALRITGSQVSLGATSSSKRRSAMGSTVRIDDSQSRAELFELRSPSTSGAMDIASEHGLASSSQLDIDLESAPIENRSSERFPSMAEPGHRKTERDTTAGRGIERKPTVKTRSSRTIIDKIKTVLSPKRNPSQASASQTSASQITESRISASSPSPLKRLGKSNTLSRLSRRPPASEPTEPRKTARRRSDPFVVPLKEASIPSRPSTAMGMTGSHQRRKSWLSGGENWVKRLSMLVEGEEDESLRSSSRAGDRQSLSFKTQHDNKPQRAPSFLSRILPARTSSLGTDLGPPAFKRPGLPTSISTPALHLHRLSTVDLSLDLDLPEVSGLGLDDILIDSRRQGIIASLDLDQEFAFPLPPSSHPMGHGPSPVRSHSRGTSEPVPSRASDPSRAAWQSAALARSGSHKRNVSEPGGNPPMLEQTSTISEKGSSLFPETPHLPSRRIDSGYARPRQTLQSSTSEPNIDIRQDLAGSGLTVRDVTPGISSPNSTLFPTRSSAYSEESEPGYVVEAMISKLDVRGTAKADLLNMAEIKGLNNSSPWASTSNL